MTDTPDKKWLARQAAFELYMLLIRKDDVAEAELIAALDKCSNTNDDLVFTLSAGKTYPPEEEDMDVELDIADDDTVTDKRSVLVATEDGATTRAAHEPDVDTEGTAIE